MSSRNGLRRKIVLPVTVVRSKLGQSQLAHTVDLSDTSARLGGLTMLLEPGEAVEIKREGVTAKFQVFWMGSPGTAMEGQAGIRSLEPDKPIWGSGAKDGAGEDTTGSEIDVPVSLPEATAPLPGEKRWHARLECTGSASVLSLGSQFPVRGQIKDVSQGGIYVEVTTPLAVKSKVSLEGTIEGIAFEAKGVIRTSYPMVGMGISFQTISPENEEKLARILEKVTARLQGNHPAPAPSSPTQTAKPAALRLDAYPVRVLVMACQALATDFEQWKGTHSPAEIAELRRAVHDLYQKLSVKSESGPQVELMDYVSTTKPRGGAA